MSHSVAPNDAAMPPRPAFVATPPLGFQQKSPQGNCKIFYYNTLVCCLRQHTCYPSHTVSQQRVNGKRGGTPVFH